VCSSDLGTNDNNGNVRRQQIRRGSAFDLTQYYLYDGVNRLAIMTEEITPPTPAPPTNLDGCPAGTCRDYLIDQYGNRAMTGTAAAMAAPSSLGQFSTSTNRITAGTYDPAGNLTALANLAQSMSYDAVNKMTSFSDSTGSLLRTGTYVYDGQGNRVKSSSQIGSNPSKTTTYVYDAFGKIAAEYSTQAPSEGGTFYRTTDHLGSTRLVTDANQDVFQCRDFYPYGERIASGVGGRNAAPLDGCYGETDDPFKQQFTEKERDEESGLDYFRARYYASTAGRFTRTSIGKN